MNRKKREQLICDAAVSVFARAGFERTSVSEIIDEAQVARGTFYLYFKNKREVFRAILDRFLLELSAIVATPQLTSETAGGEMTAAYRRLAHNLASTVKKNRLLAKLILTDHGRQNAEASRELDLFFSRLIQMIAHHLHEQVRQGVIRNIHGEVLAASLVGTAKEMAMEWILKDDSEINSKIDAMVDLYAHGLIPAEMSLDKTLGQESQKRVATANLTNWH